MLRLFAVFVATLVFAASTSANDGHCRRRIALERLYNLQHLMLSDSGSREEAGPLRPRNDTWSSLMKRILHYNRRAVASTRCVSHIFLPGSTVTLDGKTIIDKGKLQIQ